MFKFNSYSHTFREGFDLPVRSCAPLHYPAQWCASPILTRCKRPLSLLLYPVFTFDFSFWVIFLMSANGNLITKTLSLISRNSLKVYKWGQSSARGSAFLRWWEVTQSHVRPLRTACIYARRTSSSLLDTKVPPMGGCNDYTAKTSSWCQSGNCLFSF